MRRRSLAARPATALVELQKTDEILVTARMVSKGLTPEQLLARMEKLQVFKTHIEELSPMLRTVFVLRVMRECTTDETAKILSVSENTVKARLWRARRKLAKRLTRTSF
jgi:RNA polymerase sigma factor (sigma-70 family)